MRYEISLEQANEAVKPADLFDVLMSLSQNHVVRSWEIDRVAGKVTIDADAGLEAAFLLAQDSEPRTVGTFRTGSAWLNQGPSRSCGHRPFVRSPDKLHELVLARDTGRLHAETTRAYYSQAQEFIASEDFRQLGHRPKAFQRKLWRRRQKVWKLHAEGLSSYEIATELDLPQTTVERDIAAVRPLAGLDPQKR